VKVRGQSGIVERVGLTAVVGAALVFAVAHAAVGAGEPSNVVDPSPAFTITSTISSSPASQVAALLYPGTPRFLWYTAHNSLKVPITVISMSIQDVTANTGCPVGNLDLDRTTFSGSLVVPAMGANAVSVPISLDDIGDNQDACEGVTFDFAFAGSATFSEVYSTLTAVASSRNPSSVGETVTYTATVTANAVDGQDPVPSSPTGTVTFLDGTDTICSAVPVVSATVTTATATCSPAVYEEPEMHDVTAVYTNSDGNFMDSTSSVLPQAVTP
jgi:hypothetical protein